MDDAPDQVQKLPHGGAHRHDGKLSSGEQTFAEGADEGLWFLAETAGM